MTRAAPRCWAPTRRPQGNFTPVPDAAQDLSVVVALGVVALTLLYLLGWERLGRHGPRVVSGWRLLAFFLGLAALWVAVGSPLSSLDHRRLTFHMVQHLLLMNVCAPFLLLGAPFVVLARVLPPGVFSGLSRGLRSRAGRLLTHPCVTWLFAAAVVVGWHVPAGLALTLHSPLWHAVQHASFLLAGLLFFWPVVLPWPAVAVWPRWTAPLYLFLATLPCDVLSAFLAFSGRVVYPHYLSAQQGGSDASALADQALAGAVMWCVVTVGYLVPAVVIALQLLQPSRRPPASTA
jgi:putative membrane protein